MKKIFAAIAIAILLIPTICFGAAETANVNQSAQGIFKIFTFTGKINTGDTFTGPSTPKAYWASTTTGTVAVVESSGTYTFYTSPGDATVTLYVVE